MIASNKDPHRYLIRPSDATLWVFCTRRAWLNKHQPVESEIDPFNQLLIDSGLDHEAATLAQLDKQYPVIKAESHDHTLTLMQQGVPVIYQGQLINESEGIIGNPDFLIRHQNGHYQPADAKLSLSEYKKAIRIQLGIYRRLLANGLPAMIFLGDGRIAQIGDEVDPLVDKFILGMRTIFNSQQQPSVRYSHSKCRTCPYLTRCHSEFRAKEDLSLLYGIHGDTAEYLENFGISTITQLSTITAETIPDVPYLKGHRRKYRATLQAQSFLTGKLFILNKVELPQGTWIHFDIEDNPLTPDRERHVYLWGLLPPSYEKESFDYVWSDDKSSDYQGWLGFLQKIENYREQYGPFVLAHYSNHEKATIRKYAERYAMENHTIVAWLLGTDSPLFDMQKPVLDCLVLPLQGYGLKDICKHPGLVNFQWENKESGSQWSVVKFNQFRSESSLIEKQRIKTEILGYNRDDVIATRQLELWLRRLFS